MSGFDLPILSPMSNTILASDLRALVVALERELGRPANEDRSALRDELTGAGSATPAQIVRYNQGAIALAQLRDAQKKRLRLALGIGSGVVGLGVAIYAFSVLRK